MPILSEFVVIALPESHLLASHPQILLQALANKPFFLPSPDVIPSYGQIISLCQQVGFSLKVVC